MVSGATTLWVWRFEETFHKAVAFVSSSDTKAQRKPQGSDREGDDCCEGGFHEQDTSQRPYSYHRRS